MWCGLIQKGGAARNLWRGNMFDLEMESGFFGARKMVLFYSVVVKEKMGLKEGKRAGDEEEMGIGVNGVMGFYGLPSGYLGIYIMNNEYNVRNRNMGM